MPVFKTFFRIVYKNKGTVFLYLGLFLAITIIITSLTGNPSEAVYADAAVSVTLLDRDNSLVSKAILSYLSETQNLKQISDTKDALQDALFFRDVEYVLIIPEGFQTALLSGNMDLAQNINVPNSFSSIYINMQVEQLISFIRTYIVAGFPIEKAITASIATMRKKASVHFMNEEKKLSFSRKYSFYYQYIPYMLLGVLVQLIGIIFLSFNKEEVRKRTLCSSTTLKSRNIQLLEGCLILACGIWLILILISFLLYGEEIRSSKTLPFLLMNTATFTIVSISLGFLIGTFVKNENQLAAFSNTLAMVFSFLGGVFVSLNMMNEKIRVLSSFTPTYWYITTNTELGHAQSFSGVDIVSFFQHIGIQIGFAFAFFTLALVVSKKRSSSQ